MHPVTLLIIIGLAALILMVIRFILPEVIYTIRAAVNRIRYAKAFLDIAAGKSINEDEYKNLLVNDSRTEASLIAMGDSLERINEIRELVFVFSHTRNHQYLARKWKPQYCIVEATSLLGNLARRIEPINESADHIVDAHTILDFIYQQQHMPQSEKKKRMNAADLEKWLQENPISIEQVSEIVFSAIFGIAYRYRKQREEN